MNPRRAYDLLLRLYPSDFRAVFSAEMASTFEEAAAECGRAGRPEFVRFIAKEFIGLTRGAGAEWAGKCAYSLYRTANLAGHYSLSAELVAQLTYATCRSNGSFRIRFGPDLRMMRPVGIARDDWYGARPLRSEA